HRTCHRRGCDASRTNGGGSVLAGFASEPRVIAHDNNRVRKLNQIEFMHCHPTATSTVRCMVTADGPSATPPQGIVPRWEWRTFGDRFEVAGRVLADQTPQSPVESDEIYVLSVHSDASMKARGALADVKARVRVTDGGRERA